MLCLWGLNCLGPDNRSGRFESLGLGVRSLLPVCCHGQVGTLVHLGLCPLVFFFYPPWDAFMVPYLFIISTLVILLQGLVLLFPLFSLAAILLPALRFRVPTEEQSGLVGN